MKNALVTGAEGFIGRHMTDALVANGWNVWGIDLPDDARDYFRNTMPGHFLTPPQEVDLVVHAAAVVGGREMIDGRPLALAVNLELDAALFQWAARAKPGRVVYISSPAVYPVMLQGHDGARPLREEAVTLSAPIVGVPDQLYGWSKLTGEVLAERARGEGLQVTVVRPFSGYGEDQNPDEYPFPALARRARNREDPFVIWGNGEQVRDWIHVDDICAAILLMVEQGIDGPVNIGTGRPVSMRQLAAMFAAAAGYEPEFRPLPHKPSGVAYRVADTARLNGFYKPAVTLEDGIERAIKGRM